MKKLLSLITLLAIFPAYFAYANEGDLSTYFCDEHFRNIIRRQANLNDSEPLTTAHLSDIRDLTLHGEGIRCLVGIELLPNLRTLSILDNNISELDIRQNTHLAALRIHHNYFAAEYPHNIEGLRLDEGFIFELGVNPKGTPPPHEDCIGASNFATPLPSTQEPIPTNTPTYENEPIDEFSGNTIDQTKTNYETIPAEPTPTETTTSLLDHLTVQIPRGTWENNENWSQTLTLAVNLAKIDGKWEVANTSELIADSSNTYVIIILSILLAVSVVIIILLLVFRVRK